MQDSLFHSFTKALVDLFSKCESLIVGFAASVVGYFMPVKDIVNFLLIFFLLDVAFGYWAAHKLRKERFSVQIIWTHTMPRMLISIVLILGAYMWDKTYNQDVVSTYKLIGWFISGVLLFSIAENGYQITRWAVFPNIANLIGGKVKERTGMDANIKNTDDGQTDH